MWDSIEDEYWEQKNPKPQDLSRIGKTFGRDAKGGLVIVEDPYVQLKEPTVVTIRDGGVRNNGVNYTQYSHLPMGDWDWADPVHDPRSVTIRDLGDLTQNFMDVKPEGIHRLYMTPGGVHAFNLTDRQRPKEYFARPDIQAMNIDPGYSRLAQYSEYNKFRDGSFNVRTSPKLERIAANKPDWVSFPLGDLSFTDKPINPQSQFELKKYHDHTISKWLNSNKAQRLAAMEMVNQRMATVPQSVRKLWGM